MVLNDLVYSCILEVGQKTSFKDYCGLLDANVTFKGKALGISFGFYCNNLTTHLILYRKL